MGTNLSDKEQCRVRFVNDPTRVGILTGRKQTRRKRTILQVQFTDGIRWVPEKQLEEINDIRLSPLDMLETKKLGRPVDLRRTLTHVKLSGRLADVIYSMETTNTDFYAYQFKPVIKILESPSNSILIADEVGLGKTIEAGLIWTELRSRYDMRRLLVLCPAALREKWYHELSARFGVSAQICDAAEALNILRDEGSQSRGFAIIASFQGLRPPEGWEYGIERPAAQLARLMMSMENEDRLVDLLVIDEAHHLRNPKTQTNKLGQLCKNVSEYTVLLTATPIHNRNEDLFSLLQLLDPDTFTRPEVFTQVLQANAPLVRARDLVLGANFNSEELRTLLHSARSHPLLQSNRQLLAIEKTDLMYDDPVQNRNVRSRLAYRLETVNLLAHVVTRTRKRDVKEWRVIREPTPEFVNLHPIEEKFYNLVTEIVVEYALNQQTNKDFLLAQPQRQMTSSMAASLHSWRSKLISLEEIIELGEEDEVEKKRESLGPLVTEIVLRSRNYVELDQLKKVDSKYNRLIKILIEFLRSNPNEKIIVFSSFRATLAYLADRLEDDGLTCIQLKGGQKETKYETINRFKKPDGPSVLLSSEVGGEGVDIQFSHVVINYDLPWNPMRLEQRIGRVDRLGQYADKIIIWNILYENTIDARIYRRLYDKLDLCRTALGDFEGILGDSIRKLEIDLLSGRLTEEQQEQRIEQTAQALENLRIEESQLEQDAASLVAYGDYILNQVQAAKELHRWISGSDIKRYVFDYLKLHYPGCVLQQVEQDSPIYAIELSDQAKFDLKEFTKKHHTAFITRLTSSSRPIRCRFENRVTGSLNPSEELISQFHPLVRMVSAKITNSEEQLTPAVALLLRRDAVDVQIEPGLYILAATLWSFRGLQDVEKLAYMATPFKKSDNVMDPGTAEKLAAAAVSYGEDWLEARNVIDLDRAYYLANEILFGTLEDEFDVFVNDLKAKNEDRADIQLRTLEQHYRRRMEQLEGTLDKHIEMDRTSLIKAIEGQIRALHSRVEQQRFRIESRREVQAEAREIAIAVIQII